MAILLVIGACFHGGMRRFFNRGRVAVIANAAFLQEVVPVGFGKGVGDRRGAVDQRRGVFHFLSGEGGGRGGTPISEPTHWPE